MVKASTRIIKKYKLNNNSKILDLGCKKGFIMNDFKKILPGCEVWGIEDHQYPIKKSMSLIRTKIKVIIMTFLLKIIILTL